MEELCPQTSTDGLWRKAAVQLRRRMSALGLAETGQQSPTSFPDTSGGVPVLRVIFAVRPSRETLKKSLRHSGFGAPILSPHLQAANFPCKIHCLRVALAGAIRTTSPAWESRSKSRHSHSSMQVGVVCYLRSRCRQKVGSRNQRVHERNRSFRRPVDC